MLSPAWSDTTAELNRHKPIFVDAIRQRGIIHARHVCAGHRGVERLQLKLRPSFFTVTDEEHVPLATVQSKALY
jgi:hypothetical protein